MTHARSSVIVRWPVAEVDLKIGVCTRTHGYIHPNSSETPLIKIAPSTTHSVAVVVRSSVLDGSKQSARRLASSGPARRAPKISALLDDFDVDKLARS